MCCCCCCCPPAITALFCLWVRSGFSKDSVAGALTFFPPDPALYRFDRYGKDGERLADEGDDDDEEKATPDEDNGEDDLEGDFLRDVDAAEAGKGEGEDFSEADRRRRAEKGSSDGAGKKCDGGDKQKENGKKAKRGGGKNGDKKRSPQKKAESSSSSDIPDDDESDDEETSPARALTERSRALRRRAKIRNARDARDDAAGVTYRFVPDPRLAVPPPHPGPVEAIKIGPHRKTKAYVAALVYRVHPDRATSRTKTLIYSHGNATDVGAMHYMQSILARSLEINVVVYDYSGYGESGGVPMESNTYRDIKTVYNYVVENIAAGGKESNVVIYGQSVGSGPSCYLCSKRKGVGGLILHSPFTSGMRVLTPSRALACLDIFPNIDRISKVECPVMIIHGKLDEEVDVHHGMALHDAVRRDLQREPWWVPDRGHNDITDGPGKVAEYLRRLRAFLDSL